VRKNLLYCFIAVAALMFFAGCGKNPNEGKNAKETIPPGAIESKTPQTKFVEGVERMKIVEKCPTLGTLYKECLVSTYSQNFHYTWNLLSSDAPEVCKNLNAQTMTTMQRILIIMNALGRNANVPEDKKKEVEKEIGEFKAQMGAILGTAKDGKKFFDMMMPIWYGSGAPALSETVVNDKLAVVGETIDGDKGVITVKDLVREAEIKYPCVKENGVWKLEAKTLLAGYAPTVEQLAMPCMTLLLAGQLGAAAVQSEVPALPAREEAAAIFDKMKLDGKVVESAKEAIKKGGLAEDKKAAFQKEVDTRRVALKEKCPTLGAQYIDLMMALYDKDYEKAWSMLSADAPTAFANCPYMLTSEAEASLALAEKEIMKEGLADDKKAALQKEIDAQRAALLAMKGEEEIRAPLTLKVIEVLVSDGQKVTKGQMLLKLDHTELDKQLAKATEAYDEAKKQNDDAQAKGDEAEKKRLQKALEQCAAEQKRISRQIEQCTVLSPLDGQVLTPKIQNLKDKEVKAGDILCSVGDPDAVKAAKEDGKKFFLAMTKQWQAAHTAVLFAMLKEGKFELIGETIKDDKGFIAFKVRDVGEVHYWFVKEDNVWKEAAKGVTGEADYDKEKSK
jgi:biotin carboxyl carrier protein